MQLLAREAHLYAAHTQDGNNDGGEGRKQNVSGNQARVHACLSVTIAHAFFLHILHCADPRPSPLLVERKRKQETERENKASHYAAFHSGSSNTVHASTNPVTQSRFLHCNIMCSNYTRIISRQNIN